MAACRAKPARLSARNSENLADLSDRSAHYVVEPVLAAIDGSDEARTTFDLRHAYLLAGKTPEDQNIAPRACWQIFRNKAREIQRGAIRA